MTARMTGRMDEEPLLVNFLPIRGGQKIAVSDSVEGWCATGNLGASRVSICMDDRTDGQRDDETDGRRDEFRGCFISSWLYLDTVHSHCPSGFKGSFIVPLREGPGGGAWRVKEPEWEMRRTGRGCRQGKEPKSKMRRTMVAVGTNGCLKRNFF
jgi:hypothetical protein